MGLGAMMKDLVGFMVATPKKIKDNPRPPKSSMRVILSTTGPKEVKLLRRKKLDIRKQLSLK